MTYAILITNERTDEKSLVGPFDDAGVAFRRCEAEANKIHKELDDEQFEVNADNEGYVCIERDRGDCSEVVISWAVIEMTAPSKEV